MSNWRRSRPLALAVIIAFLVVQLAIPISRLENEDTRRFGWRMFSVTRLAPEFVVVTGTEDMEIVIEDYMARVRADIDIAGLLPAHLCAVVPDARKVTWEDGEHPC